ncbi:MAG: hypothetical protein GXP25_14190 [Planctomycetes bacterium]|nr:hypothetical protein [Planctomycetota bacterium]
MAKHGKNKKREKRRQHARKEKRRKLLAGAFREEWLDWPVLGACMTSHEFWRICGQATLCAYRESESGPSVCAISEIDLCRGGIDNLTIRRLAGEADFDDAVRSIADDTGRRITALEPEEASRLFWGVYAFARHIGTDMTPTIRTRAPFFPRPAGDPEQWADALTGPWKLVDPRLLELAQTHQRRSGQLDDQPALILTTLSCRVSDPKRLAEFLENRKPEVTGGPAEEDGLLLFDWTGPIPGLSLLDDEDPSFVAAQRLLAQAALKENVLTIEARASLWTAQFYEMIARSLRDVLTIESVRWSSFRDILPP